MEIKFNPKRKTQKMGLVLLAATFFVKALRIGKYDAAIELIAVKDMLVKTGSMANCDYPETGFVVIRFDPSLSKDKLIQTLAHELVHARQFLKGRLSHRKGLQLWNGKPVSYKVPYHLEPWELEAMSKELTMYHAFFHYLEKL